MSSYSGKEKLLIPFLGCNVKLYPGRHSLGNRL